MKDTRKKNRICFAISAILLMVLIGLFSLDNKTSKTDAQQDISTKSSVDETTQKVQIPLVSATSTEDIIEEDNDVITYELSSDAPDDIEDELAEEIVDVVETTPIIPDTSYFKVRFIDVGQADASLIECDGHYMLIDGGNRDDSRLIYSVLKNEEITNIDIIVGTHAHEDHIGGLAGALNYATADIVLCPVTSYDSKAFNSFLKYAEMNGHGLVVPNVGDQYPLGNALVTILGVNSSDETNNTSIVLRIDYGETSFLFTGDAEREAEQVLLDSNVNLSATVLKIGHHGSKTSTTYPFLREVMPEYAVISVGKDNEYNHPTEDALSKLRDAGAKILRTDLNGNIIFTSDGKSVTYSVDKEASQDEIMTPGYTITYQQTETTTEPQVSDSALTYVLNTNTKKFHYPSCSSVTQMKEKNKEIINATRDEIISMGYSPCGNCKP